MKVLGINFTKISGERFSGQVKELKINTNVNILEISQFESKLSSPDEKLLIVGFINTLSYEPHLAKIELKGDILISLEEDLFKEILNDWKNKKISNKFKLPLFNLILNKSSLKSLQLEEALQIPFHIPLPSLKKTPKKQ